MKSTTIAVDLAKSIFEVAVSHHPGQVSSRHRLTRARLVGFFQQQPASTVVLEACGSAHHWGRQFEAMGHSVRLLPARYVKPYLRRSKTDRADAAALLEACRNREIHPVPVKTLSQQALASLHRLRSGWLATRTCRINTVRGILREFGITLPVGSGHIVPGVTALLDQQDSPLPSTLHPAVAEILGEIRSLETRINDIERQLRALARQTPAVSRLMSIQGIGLLGATALVAAVGDIQRFRSCRHFASFLGLTPREHSSGLKQRLGSISKSGDTYLRMLLIHGGRSVLRAATVQRDKTRLHQWALQVQQRRGHNKAAVAVANKLARIAWAVWRRDEINAPTLMA